MKAKIFPLLAMVSAGLFLTACGGGGGGGESASASVVLSGVVEDGPVERARVHLRDRASGETLRVCGASGVGRCETLTAEDGSFFLRVDESALSRPLEIVTSGGFDRSTGVDFAGMPLRAPLEFFAGLEGRIAVTPLTSILAARMRGNADPAAVRREAARDLGVSEGDLVARPSADPRLLARALMLTALAMEMADAGAADPFESIGRAVQGGAPVLVDGEPNGDRRGEWGLDEAAGARLRELGEALRSGGSDLSRRFRTAALLKAVEKSARAMLEESGAFDRENPAFRRNAAALAEKIAEASSSSPLPLRGVAPQRVARYVLFTYRLDSPGAFLAEPAVFEAALIHPETLSPLERDPRIAELASLRALYSVSVPLLKSELPGDDNLKRLQYFYSSDASPFYLAEKFAGEIFDNNITDLILLEVARGKAAAGLLEEARTIVDTQIFRDEPKARAYDAVADKAIDFVQPAVAVELLGLSEKFIKKAYTPDPLPEGSLPVRVLSGTEAAYIQQIGADFQRAGDMAGWRRMTDYLKLFLPQRSVGVYSAVLSETGKLADSYIEAGLPGEALPLLGLMEELSLGYPETTTSGKTTYRWRIYYLKETARRYADMGRSEEVADLYRLAQEIRRQDGLPQNLTGQESWSSMPDFVEFLYRTGWPEEALKLADTIPAPNNLAARKLVANYEALQSGWESALALVGAHQWPAADRVEVLTHGANTKRPYIALLLIEAGRMDEARRALESAAALVPLLGPSEMVKSYAKIADLYRRAGDERKALDTLVQAEAVAAALSRLEEQVGAFIDIHVVYRNLGRDQKAKELFLEAAGRIRERQGTVAGATRTLQVERLVTESLKMKDRDALAGLLPPLTEAAREVFTPSLTGDNRDKAAKDQIGYYLRIAGYALLLPDALAVPALGKPGREYARGLLDEAVATSRFHSAREILFNDPKADNIVGGFAAAGYLQEAKDLIRQQLPPGNQRNLGFQAIGSALAARDDFPRFASVSIDTDGDARPDFFHPFVLADAGLELDGDSDGDGIPDAEDRRPFFRDERVEERG